MGASRLKAVILAGGRGSRLSEETDSKPKPMVEIGGRPILWHIMKIYAHHGVEDFIVCLGYKGSKIKEYFFHYNLYSSDVTIDMRKGVTVHQSVAEDWRITLVETGLETQTGGRMKRVARYLGDAPLFCMTYGDAVADIDIKREIAFHKSHGRLATVGAVRPLPRFGGLSVEGEHVGHFEEKPVEEGGLINGGFFVLSPKVLDLIEGDAMPWESVPLQTLARDGELMAFRHEGFWRPMDTLRDRFDLEAMWETGRAPWKLWPDSAS
jgi:glucose-1-phosphate cytidylyltransferase